MKVTVACDVTESQASRLVDLFVDRDEGDFNDDLVHYSVVDGQVAEWLGDAAGGLNGYIDAESSNDAYNPYSELIEDLQEAAWGWFQGGL